MRVGVPLAIALVSAVVVQAETFYVSSGNETAGWSLLKGDLAGNSSTFSPSIGSWISGVAFDGEGTLYASVINSGTVYKFDAGGTPTVFARLDQPCGLAFDSLGNLYVAGRNNNTITRVDANGSMSVFASTGLSTPFDLAFDGDGNLYAGNQGENTIVRFDRSGNSSVFASGIYHPYGLAFDKAGNLYVASSTAIMKYSPQGTPALFADLGYPYYAEDIAFGSGGGLYVQDLCVDDGLGRVLVLDASGHSTVILSGLERPTSLAVEPVPEASTTVLLAVAAVICFAFLPSRRRPPFAASCRAVASAKADAAY